jgi:predicted O-linked N-acetylglucosamine transferase (SPINDLY family)
MTAALSNSPPSPPSSASDATYERAMALQIAGQLDQAETIYRALLEAQPMHAGAHYCLGMLLVQRQRPADGSAHLLAAVNQQPQVADYWLGYLEALLLLGEKSAAAEILALARQHGLQGKATEDFARRLELATPAKLSAAPRDVPLAGEPVALNGALKDAAVKHATPARQPSAAEMRRRAKAIQRQETKILGLVNQGLSREALPLARAMTEKYPDHGMGWKILGALLWAVGKTEEAVEAMQVSVRLLPQDAEAHKNLAAAINEGPRVQEAEHYLRRALQIDPNTAQAHLILGHNYQLQGRYAEARASLQAAIELQAQSGATGIDPAHSLLLFVLNNDPSVSPDTLFSEHRRVGAYLESIAQRSAPRTTHERNPKRRLEVGFVSADLYNHSVARFVEPLFAAWKDNRNLRVTAYHVNSKEDGVSQRLKGYVARWNPVLGLSDAELERRIVNDGIDILIDLSGHTAANRMGTFARKPAPIQASWLGYPSTTGLSTVDYYLADRHFLPPGEFERYYTEQLVYLPAAWSFQPHEAAPAVKPLPALAAGYVTFGSFNRIAKISEQTVSLWSRLLRAVPGSKMLIAGVPVDVAAARLLPWFEQEGIAPQRVSFHSFSSLERHFELHQQVDIGLESLPYSGCTTSNHALWMGVPSLTCVGATPASRLSAANLGQLGLEEFIARDPEDFVAKGVRWAHDLPALAGVRAGLRHRWQAAPARNAGFFAAGMELALRRMWQRWCAGLPAQSFAISAEEAASAAAQ